MRNSSLIVVLAVNFFCFSCGKSDSKGGSAAVEGSLDGQGYAVSDVGTLDKSETQVGGSGTILFKSPLSEIGSKDNFLLQFRLDEGGILELITHADSTGKSGVSALISREGGTLNIAWAIGGTSSGKKALAGIDASGEIKLAIDVHNDETPAHILVWNGSGSTFTEENALTNSEEDVASPGKGSGTFWGLTLTKATVFTVSIGTPKFVEE